MAQHENPYTSTPQAASTPVDAVKGPPPKPVSPMVFGILNLVFGGFGLLSTPVNFLVIYFLENYKGPPNVAIEVMLASPGYMTFYRASLVVWMLFSILIVVAGVGLIRGRPWGRTLSMAYACIAIVWTIVAFAASYYLYWQPLSERNEPEALQGYITGLVSGTVGTLFSLIYPLLMLLFLNRENVVEYFRHQSKDARYG